MQTSNHIADPYDLTGQVALVDYMPEFKGNYSMVFRGNVRGTLVAVKVIEATGEPRSVRRKVIRERVVWASLWHQNIHPHYGFADDLAFGPIRAPYGALISPWYKNGDSARFLDEHGKRMSIDDRMKIWKGVIDGVIYLHSQTPVIVHGDLKPGNVLIDDSGNPHICDFGLAHIFFDEPGSGLTTTTEHTGTERYLAPELVINNADVRPTTASDVYALGCLGLDFIYLQKPYSHRRNNARGIIFADIRKRVAPATGLPDVYPGMSALLKACWSRKPLARPSALTAASRLKKTPPIFPLEIANMVTCFASETEGASHHENDVPAWRRRTQLLLALSLVSREYRELSIPHLYEDIRFLCLKVGAIGPAQLLSTLQANADNTFTRLRRYESYTRSLVLHSDSLWGSDLGLRILGVAKVLLQRFDALKSVVVKSDYCEESGGNPYDLNIQPRPLGDSALLTSVTFAGLAVSDIMEGLRAFQGLKILQELRIISPRDGYCPGSILGSLPKLESLSVESDPGVLNLLPELSGWGFPQLKYFSLISRNRHNILRFDLDLFLTSHGHSLRLLMCYMYSPPPLDSVLRRCPNLQFISYPIQQLYYSDSFPQHQSLVAINLLYVEPIFFTPEFHLFDPEALQLFGYHLRAHCPCLATAKILIRNEPWILQKSFFINIQDGAINERDGISMNYDKATGWIQTVG